MLNRIKLMIHMLAHRKCSKIELAYDTEGIHIYVYNAFGYVVLV